MSYNNNGFKKFVLSISGLLLITFLVSSVLLLSRIDEVLGGSSSNQINSEPDRTPEEQQIFDNLPESTKYRLRRSSTDYQIELFEILVHAHDSFQENNTTSNLEDYGGAIVRNFIADFFTLSNKESRTDVGGLQFFSEDLVDNFKNFAIDDFYLYLNQHITAFGSEALPTVSSTTILDVGFEPRTIPIREGDDESEEITLVYNEFWEVIGQEIMTIVIDAQWSYESSSLLSIEQFQTTARFVLVQYENDVKIYAIELVPEEDEGEWAFPG